MRLWDAAVDLWLSFTKPTATVVPYAAGGVLRWLWYDTDNPSIGEQNFTYVSEAVRSATDIGYYVGHVLSRATVVQYVHVNAVMWMWQAQYATFGAGPFATRQEAIDDAAALGFYVDD